MKKMSPSTKRKIAGVIAIVLIVAMVLGAVAPLFLGTAYGAESQQFTIEAQLGFNGMLKIENNNPITIRVTNNSGKDFKGEVSIVTKTEDTSGFMANSKEKTVEYFSELELSAGDTKEITGGFPVNTIEYNYKIELKDKKGKEVEKKSVGVTTQREDSLWLGVLSDSDRTKNSLSANFNNLVNRYGIDQIVDVTTSEIEYLDCLNVLVINDFDMNSLDEIQLDRISAWLNDGGVIVFGTDGTAEGQTWFDKMTGGSAASNISGYIGEESRQNVLLNFGYILDNNNYDEARKEELMSVADGLDTESLVKLVSLYSYYSVYDKTLLSDIETDLTSQYWSDNTELSGYIDDQYNTITETSRDFKQFDLVPVYSGGTTALTGSIYIVGKGFIYLFPQNAVAESMMNADIVLNNVNYSSSNERFGLDKPKDIAGAFFLAIIMIYAIFIGPFLYLILKKKDKKESAVKIIPVSAAVLSAMIVLCSFGSNFQRPMASVVNMVKAAEKGKGVVDGHITCAAPLKGSLRIQNDTVARAEIKNRSYYGDAKSCKIALNGFDYTNFESTKWETSSFKYKDTIDLNGSLDVWVVSSNASTGEYTINISNNTGYDLDDICLSTAYQEGYYIAKHLKNGETVSYTGNFSGNNYSYNFRPRYSGMDEYTAYQKLSSNKRYASQNDTNDLIKVTGFMKSDIAGTFKMNGRKAAKNEITAFYNYVNANDMIMN